MRSSPRTQETALAGGSPNEHSGQTARVDSTTSVGTRRNAGRRGTWREDGASAGGRPLGGRNAACGGVREEWVRWLSPVFADGSAAYFTGTYADEYGYANGLMLTRNVHKDVQRFLNDRAGFVDLSERRWICGVEKHRYRDILHWHGIIEGPFSEDELRYLKLLWQLERGFARVLPVTDGCASYVTKYALKGDTDSFEWRLS